MPIVLRRSIINRNTYAIVNKSYYHGDETVVDGLSFAGARRRLALLTGRRFYWSRGEYSRVTDFR